MLSFHALRGCGTHLCMKYMPRCIALALKHLLLAVGHYSHLGVCVCLQAADKLIRLFAEQIFYTGFIHADPHPGNGTKGCELGWRQEGAQREVWKA